MLRRQTSFPPSNLGITVPLVLPEDRNLPAASGSPMVAERPILLGSQPASLQSLSMRQKV